jgi:transposase
MAQGIFPGFSILELQDDGECYHVIYAFTRFYSFRKDDAAALRLVVVQLANMGVPKTELRRTFGMARTTIDRWLAVYAEGGVPALVDLRTGPEAKVTDSVRDYMIALYRRLGGQHGYVKTILDEVAQLYGVTVSRETLRTVLDEWKASCEQGDSTDHESEPTAETEGSDGEGDNEEQVEAREQTDTEVESREEEDASEAAGPEEVAAEEEEAGEEPVEHGGTLLALPLLADYDVERMVPRERAKGSNGYSSLESFFSVLLLLIARLLRVEENIKLHDDPALGGLIGRWRLPSLRTIRQAMGVLVEKIKRKIDGLKIGFARSCLSLREAVGTFYIDGHFMPYTGEETVLKGYNPQRRLAEKGRTAYVVSTGCGRPLYEMLSDGFDHFHDALRRLADVLVEKLGIARPTIVMDRGGYGEKLFQAIEPKADFICWHMGNPHLPNNATWQNIEIPVQSNTWGEPEYETVKCTERVAARGAKNGIGHRRVFFIQRGNKVSPAITSKRDATLEELVLDLTRRWGAQENPFKELKADGYDCLHSYEKDEFSEEQLRSEGLDRNRTMENPEHRKLVAERRKLNSQRERILGRQAARERKGKAKSKGKRRRTATAKEKRNLKRIQSRLRTVEKRLSYLPERILRLDYINTNGIARLASDKKKYFDLMNFVAFNVRKDMAEIIGPVYQNNRDIHQIVLKLLRLNATVQWKSNETLVTFRSPGRKQEKEALVHLCEVLTALERTSALFPGKLVYRVT